MGERRSYSSRSFQKGTRRSASSPPGASLLEWQHPQIGDRAAGDRGGEAVGVCREPVGGVPAVAPARDPHPLRVDIRVLPDRRVHPCQEVLLVYHPPTPRRWRTRRRSHSPRNRAGSSRARTFPRWRGRGRSGRRCSRTLRGVHRGSSAPSGTSARAGIPPASPPTLRSPSPSPTVQVRRSAGIRVTSESQASLKEVTRRSSRPFRSATKTSSGESGSVEVYAITRSSAEKETEPSCRSPVVTCRTSPPATGTSKRCELPPVPVVKRMRRPSGVHSGRPGSSVQSAVSARGAPRKEPLPSNLHHHHLRLRPRNGGREEGEPTARPATRRARTRYRGLR